MISGWKKSFTYISECRLYGRLVMWTFLVLHSKVFKGSFIYSLLCNFIMISLNGLLYWRWSAFQLLSLSFLPPAFWAKKKGSPVAAHDHNFLSGDCVLSWKSSVIPESKNKSRPTNPPWVEHKPHEWKHLCF